MQKNTKTDIRSLDLPGLQQHFSDMKEPAYRAKQVYQWLWEKSARSFDEMSNLSKELRKKLDEHYVINTVEISNAQFSNDRTIKNAFRLYDNNIVEGVLIPTEDRMTACVSSQVGCSLTCKFCATGYMDRKRNLNADEIYDQVVLIDQQAKQNYNVPLTNIVYMGMGEPLLNYANVLKSIERITAPDGLNMSYKRITVSTAGIAKMIKKLGDDGVKFNLALSLHAANDKKRNEIMPISEHNSLKALAEALKYYFQKTKNPVTYEYIVFNDFNDELEDAMELEKFCKHVPCKVNLIEYNPIQFADFLNADGDKIDAFANYLRSKGVNTNIRRSRGKDIDAACGQLAVKEKA
ncbi:23S rRNA (adenine(2503)-C(2))-methyltransferase RlmN [Pedobacter montanisoli]|uniref:Probable dual-specificity RNA methyltransferase RlmN n=1 Tax=Pedobacter montanisoli TaxID=2923277 RepID=A0ABS9ZSX8_9SPHI|nr:23S rRNA (adenine(2503)-C(2))-methyltransferase RlmN [Pedobacter montanisoli]MCJ0741477.1 23S rRNA (adenine(2503)-C(2))-methyltransferase RlmN [Pedobacter montanisoli]